MDLALIFSFMDVCTFALFNKHTALCARPQSFTNTNSFNPQNILFVVATLIFLIS